MPFDFLCPQCGQSVNAPDEMAGQTAPCPLCKTTIVVPVPGQAAAPDTPVPTLPAAPDAPAVGSGAVPGPAPWFPGVPAASTGAPPMPAFPGVAPPAAQPPLTAPAELPSLTGPAGPAPPPGAPAAPGLAPTDAPGPIDFVPPAEPSATNVTALAEGRRRPGGHKLLIMCGPLVVVAAAAALWLLVLKGAGPQPVDADLGSATVTRLPSSNIFQLGDEFSIGDIKVVPMEVAARHIVKVDLDGNTKRSDKLVLVLPMRITNTNREKRVFPYPRDAARDQQNSFIASAGKPGYAWIRCYPLAKDSEWTIKDQNCDEELLPGATETYLAIADEGSAKKATGRTSDMLWRVVLHTGPRQVDKPPRNTVVGVRFHADDIREEK